MNKKTYVRPTVLERNVRVSMMCLSDLKRVHSATSDTFVRGENDIVDLQGIGAKNDDIWGDNVSID